MDFNKIILVDIGNTFAKIFSDGNLLRIKAVDFINNLPQDEFFYISVNQRVSKDLRLVKNAINLEPFIKINSSYKGLGVDRKILCYYIKNGVIVDAGSAITVDVMEKSSHKGGFILPGISAFFEAYKKISPVLVAKRSEIDLNNLPLDTNSAINYAIFKSIILNIKDISKDKKIYFCGGDGKELVKFFKNAVYEKNLIFDAMKNLIKDIYANGGFAKR